MESFIFGALNKASREKDISKIEFYGALSSALSFILHSGNKIQTGFPKTFTVYRGLQLMEDELLEYTKGNTITLKGFTSCSNNFKTALKFASKFET